MLLVLFFHLPPPPILSKEILSRPPLLEEQLSSKIDNEDFLSSEVEYSSDILSELEKGGFGSLLKAVPKPTPSNFQAESLAINQFREAAKAYLKAADKHLEMNFFANASINYSCGVLCILLSENAFQAAHLMKELGKTIPSTIVRSQIFQGVRMLLKANILRNPEFLVKAEEWLFSDSNHLYKEDQLLLRRAMSLTVKLIEEE